MDDPRQRPLAQVPAREWDAAVIGAGPAGATAALHLARRGRSVLLVDRRWFPRDKACGDGLIQDSIHCLRRAGLYERVRERAFATTIATVFSPSRIHFEVEGEFLVLKRYLLDAILVEAAAEAGATVAHGRAIGFQARPDGSVEVAFARSPLRVRARVVLLATGADVSLLDGAPRAIPAEPSAFAIRKYVRSDHDLDRLVISFDRSITPGYAWIFPHRDREYNIGCGVFLRSRKAAAVNLRDVYRTFVSAFPLARELVSGATWESDLRGARLRCALVGSRRQRTGNILAIGESAGTTFPFTGEGIGKAMESAEIAAEVVDRALGGSMRALNSYPERLDRELRPRYRGYEIAESWLSRAWLNDFMATRLSRNPYLRRLASGIISETTDPRELFSVSTLIRSFLG